MKGIPRSLVAPEVHPNEVDRIAVELQIEGIIYLK
jgi:hypothetical protein